MTRQTLNKELEIYLENFLLSKGVLFAPSFVAELRKGILDIINSRKARKNTTCPMEWRMAICRMCGYNPATLSKAEWARVSECGIALIQYGAQLDDLDKFLEWWNNPSEFRHKIPLTPKLIQDNWGRWQNDKNSKQGFII